MRPRRLLQGVVALAMLVGPLAAVAQAILVGTVTTAPVRVAAPAMGMPLRALLAVLLAGGGAYLLRRAGGGAIAKVGLVAVLTALAGLAYANGGTTTITIKDADCGMQTVRDFHPTEPQILLSNCPNQIRIIKIQRDCNGPDPLDQCAEGQVLANNESCTLPRCTG